MLDMRKSKDDVRAWTCTGFTGYLDPSPCVVFARRAGQAKQIALNHGPGFDAVNYNDIRVRRAPEHDDKQPTSNSVGMFNADGSFHHESFKRP